MDGFVYRTRYGVALRGTLDFKAPVIHDSSQTVPGSAINILRPPQGDMSQTQLRVTVKSRGSSLERRQGA